MSLLFLKYIIALVLVLAVKVTREGWKFIRKEDIKIYLACVLFGEIIYFYCEYTAMEYLPLSIISIFVAFLPVVSVITERILYKRKTSGKVIAGIGVCIFGVALVIGVDFHSLLEGKIIGYALIAIAVVAWNMFNYITASLHQKYDTATLTANQLLCTVFILLPYMVYSIPKLPAFTPALGIQLAYIGLINSGVSFLILVKALHVLGPTTVSVFTNFLPLTTTLFSWMILQETISPIQMAGGAIVIISGYFVIKEKGKMEVLNR
jgi:drug/metabolite transporter (DMT)-like permease